jgi:hypothetical protein
MSATTSSSRVNYLLLASPSFLLVFLAVPAFIIISHLLHRPYKIDLMLVNNGCFLVCVAVRLVSYLLRLNRPLRYGAHCRVPERGFELLRSADQVRSALQAHGYHFDSAGRYGERHDAGYIGTLLLYAGLVLLLFYGTYDNLRQFTGVVRLGIGDPASISDPGVYGELVTGPAVSPAQLPKLQVRKIMAPGSQWPKGALLIGLWDNKDRMLKEGVTAPGKPLVYNGFEYTMLKFSNVADFRVIRNKNELVFVTALTMLPLPEKQGVYSFHTAVDDPGYANIKGDAWFNPDNKAMKVVLTRDGKPFIDTELELWGNNRKTEGDYTVLFSRLGQFAEIRVAHVRHFLLLKIGAVIALIGGVLRLAVRSQRVWLFDDGAGCTAKAIGSRTRKLLED